MLFSGYLKVVSEEGYEQFGLKIPNKEVKSIYKKIVLDWIINNHEANNYKDIVRNLITGRVEEFEEDFREMIYSSMSFFDPTGDKPENFYHGFTLGLLAVLIDTYNIKYNIKSNREAGKGRADIMIIPKDKSQIGIVMEFKKSNNEKELLQNAHDAINQIDEKKYEEELKSLGIENTLKVGISFCGKECELVFG